MAWEVTTEYRVTWFPPGRPDRTKTVSTRDEARAVADEHADGFPIIEVRETVRKEWRTVENYALRFDGP